MSEYYAPIDPDELKRQRQRARELRDSQWWKRRIAPGVCHYCRRQVGRLALTMDHIVPLGRGGASIRGNVVPSCKDCNSRKKGMLPVEWRQYVDSLATREDE
ncbi:MAG TPA: HNH endonuclease signature motif containing protein [Methylomirabilota bacterium]|jgi:5-methylcytosine-specific restriction endonuclease McrA|nr:HNH endonuclease signature motif containing protein [Methylomirabilota bacterium]